MTTTAPRRRLASLQSLLLMLGVFAVPTVASVAVAPLAQAAVAAGDIVFVYQGSYWPTSRPAVMAVRHSNGTVDELLSLNDDTVTYPVPSPDGSKIAFAATERRWSEQDQILQFYRELHVVNSDGSGTTIRITTSPDNTASSTRFDDASSSWCSNTVLLFQRQYSQNLLVPEFDDPTQPRLYKVNSDGSGLTKISQDDSKHYYEPECSPDGTKISFWRIGSSGRSEIWVMDSDGTDETKLLNQPTSGMNDRDNMMPTWGSNTRLYFASTSGWYGNYIYGIDTDGTDGVQVASGGGTPMDPTVSADGNTVAYYDGGNLWSKNADGTGTATQLTNTSGADEYEINPAYFKASWPTTSAQHIVALGDSVTAGEGINYGWQWDNNDNRWERIGGTNPLWVNTTRALGANWQQCHQSGKAYSRLFYADGYDVYNMACTGATGNDLLEGQTLGFTPELDPINMVQLGGSCSGCATPNAAYDAHEPDKVMLTLGANDVHFDQWVRDCFGLLATCGDSGDDALLASQLATQKNSLREVLRQIKTRGVALNPDHVPDVYVGKYHNPFPTTWPDPQLGGCVDIHPTVGTGVDADEMEWLEDGLAELNGNIQEVVDETEFSFTNFGATVKTVNLGSVMDDHRWCSADPFVYGVSIIATDSTSPAPFHPTPAGQAAIYNKFKTCMNGGSCT